MTAIANGPSIRYLIRIMDVLAGHSELTVTNLAMLSRVNHKRCLDLLLWLHESGYTRTRIFRKRRYVALTQNGCEYARHLQAVRDMTQIPVQAAYKMYVQNVSEL